MKTSCWLLALGYWLLPAMSAAAGPDSTTADSVEIVDGRTAQVSASKAWWIAVWGAGARHSKFHTRWGVRHRDFYMAGVRLGRELPVSRQFTVDYFVDVVPLLISTKNPIEYREIWTCPTPGPCKLIDVLMITATARGFGLSPIGVQLRAFPRSRVQPWVGLSMGVAWYDQPVPDPGEKQLNFMGDLGAGVHIRTGSSGAVVVGVRQHHTSNANTGPANPGIDSRVLYVGVTRSLDRRAQP